jgi:hypothetical protein
LCHFRIEVHTVGIWDQRLLIVHSELYSNPAEKNQVRTRCWRILQADAHSTLTTFRTRVPMGQQGGGYSTCGGLAFLALVVFLLADLEWPHLILLFCSSDCLCCGFKSLLSSYPYRLGELRFLKALLVQVGILGDDGWTALASARDPVGVFFV